MIKIRRIYINKRGNFLYRGMYYQRIKNENSFVKWTSWNIKYDWLGEKRDIITKKKSWWNLNLKLIYNID
jgi:hypothetical protein